MEEIVRRRHELEDRVNNFLHQIDRCATEVRTMDTRDIEICMAKLYDLMSQASHEADRLDRLFKGLLVKSVYDKRLAGEKHKCGFWSAPSFPERIIDWQFKYPIPLTETLANEWGSGGVSSVRKLLTP